MQNLYLKCLALLCFIFISHFIFSQNCDYEKYSDPTIKSLTFFKIVEMNIDELQSIEKFIEKTEKNSYNIKDFIKTLLLNTSSQNDEMYQLNLSLKDLRNNDETINLDSKNKILNSYNFKTDERKIILNYFNTISKFSTPALKIRLKYFTEYFESLNCRNYTYSEIFRDITGYDCIENLKNETNYYGLSYHHATLRIKDLNYTISCTSRENPILNISLINEEKENLQLSINTSKELINYEAQIFDINGTLLFKTGILSLEKGNNLIKLNGFTNKTKLMQIISLLDNDIVSSNTTLNK